MIVAPNREPAPIFFQLLQVGEEIRAGDFYVSSMCGRMWEVYGSMIGTIVKEGDMPHFRPLLDATGTPVQAEPVNTAT